MRYGSSVVLRTRAANCVAALILSFTLPLAARGGVIPLPAETVAGAGSFTIGPGILVRVPPGDRDAAAAARYLVELWTRTNHLTLPVMAATTGTPGIDTIGFRRKIEFRRAGGFGPDRKSVV